MRKSAQFAFGGSGLHRAADLRAAPAHIATLLAAPGARVLPLWRGKPLFAGAVPGWLAPGHAVLSGDRGALVFLGAQDGQA
ncbi:MAG: NADH pyrophosphatase, partial [Pseudorhodobacter sp.]|nr:NADH pyrophosphatase [Pseudorhodobacter sp.]